MSPSKEVWISPNAQHVWSSAPLCLPPRAAPPFAGRPNPADRNIVFADKRGKRAACRGADGPLETIASSGPCPEGPARRHRWHRDGVDPGR